MTKYTVTSLIEELKVFPKDTPIRTELVMVFNYDSDKVLEECSGKEYANEKELFDSYKKYATDLAIFEGSWEDDNISDLNNIMPEYVIGWEVEDHCGQNAILKKDIITRFFNIIVNYDVSFNDDFTVTITRYPDYKVLFDFIELLGLSQDIEEVLCKIKAQKKYAQENNLPLFAPEDGVCICGKQIYNKISLEKAQSELITYCPYCGMAYND